jgi:AraC-like DNA-binding protein
VIDPLSEVVALLKPTARFSKVVTGAGRWGVRRAQGGQPFYCAIVSGACRLTIGARPPITLQAGDFVLIPAAYDHSTMSSIEPPHEGDFDLAPTPMRPGEFRVGMQNGPSDVRLLIGHCAFDSEDADLLVSLLPRFVHVQGESRLTTLAQWVSDESREQRPAREVVMARLLEVLLIEALRSTAGTEASPGLLRGLSDQRLAVAIRQMHERPTQAWTVAELAKAAALSRSAFFERFNREVGVAPMAYLLGWRMALAKKLLRHETFGMAEVASRVGYSSASTFSVAFTRFVGQPPARYATSMKQMS